MHTATPLSRSDCLQKGEALCVGTIVQEMGGITKGWVWFGGVAKQLLRFFYTRFKSFIGITRNVKNLYLPNQVLWTILHASNKNTQSVGYGYGGFRDSVDMRILWGFPQVFLWV